MTRKLARALLAIGTLATVAISTNAEAAYHHRASRHITAHHFGRYLAYRHVHYYHRHFRHTHVARREPSFVKRRSNCQFTHGHLEQCIPHETVVWPRRSGGLTRMRVDNGTIVTVTAQFAERFEGFFHDLFQREKTLPRDIGCYAAHGHMPLPWGRHPVGEACDVGQSARNRAWGPMFRIGDLARKWGLTDGCWWSNPDCGHVQINRAVAVAPAVQAMREAKARPLVRYAGGAL